MGVQSESWLKWALSAEYVDLDIPVEMRQTCQRCGNRLFPGIWELQCDYCGYRAEYIIPVIPEPTWTDEHIPGRYGQRR